MFKPKLLYHVVVLTLFITLSNHSFHSQSADERGLQIVTEADTRNDGFGDSKADLKMILRNKNGQESTRFIRNKTLEVKGDGDKSLVIFDEPRDVKGTAFLSFTHATGPDDQW
ncbi:MAG: outer membrane lipoprotein-sorting protein, partial [Melioribacteraceae bacterium]|nr:outer membrane lipoprotein-sorting protein [Melioribacteraceae bacterium]